MLPYDVVAIDILISEPATRLRTGYAFTYYQLSLLPNMLVSSLLLALPLLVSAVPRPNQLTFQDAPSTDATWTMDLNELRLVQFSEDEPAK